MGHIRHDAIVVTHWDEDRLRRAQQKAAELGLPVTSSVNSNMNGYHSFLIAPDGSKEDWEDSRKGDEARDVWCHWVRKEGLGCDWVHVSYGGDDPELAQVRNGNARDEYK